MGVDTHVVRLRTNRSPASGSGFSSRWRSVDTKADSLGRVPLLAGLRRSELVQLAKHAEDLDAPAGTDLYREGDSACEFFIIVEGEVEVLREDDGVERTLNVLGPGDYFGEVAILRDSSRIATVKATSPTTLLAMDRDSLRSLVAGSLGTTEQFDRVIRERMTVAGQAAE